MKASHLHRYPPRHVTAHSHWSVGCCSIDLNESLSQCFPWGETEERRSWLKTPLTWDSHMRPRKQAPLSCKCCLEVTLSEQLTLRHGATPQECWAIRAELTFYLWQLSLSNESVLSLGCWQLLFSCAVGPSRLTFDLPQPGQITKWTKTNKRFLKSQFDPFWTERIWQLWFGAAVKKCECSYRETNPSSGTELRGQQSFKQCTFHRCPLAPDFYVKWFLNQTLSEVFIQKAVKH